jgi:hypothetical protein
MGGHDLIKKISELTGLPSLAAENELLRILSKANIPIEKLTVEQMRAVLALYLQETLLEAKRELEKNFD